MSKAPRYLELTDKVPSKQFKGMTVKECIDDPDGLKWIIWMQSRKGFAVLNCKLNGGEAQDYYFNALNKNETLK
jgi:predicted RNA-binding protein associated with RNAse of E/G family